MGERHLRSRGVQLARSDIDRDDGDVVGLAEALGGLRDVPCRLVAHLLGALKAEQFTTRVGGFDHAIGEEDKPDALLQLKCFLIVGHARR